MTSKAPPLGIELIKPLVRKAVEGGTLAYQVQTIHSAISGRAFFILPPPVELGHRVVYPPSHVFFGNTRSVFGTRS